MHCGDLERQLQKYAAAESKEDIYIKKTLEDVARLFTLCDQSEYYYADMITRNFCRVIEMLEKKHQKEKNAADLSRLHKQSQFPSDWDLMCAFYNHFKEEDQLDYRELRVVDAQQKARVNSTLKDYVARIYTFSGPKYLGRMFRPEELRGMNPVLFTYENLELILATFPTRDENGQIVKQRVNIRSALRKLNEFKQYTQLR